MKVLKTPIKSEEVRSLKVGNTIRISGKIFTARDEAHKKLLFEVHKDNVPEINFEGLPCFHCGPVMRKNHDWEVVSAGPTTSMRLDKLEPKFMDKFGTKIFIGKGGMGDETLKALKKNNSIYTQFTGGTGSLMADSVESVDEVYYLEELGIPEAVWVLNVEEFGPLLVTMDSNGKSLYDKVSNDVKNNLKEIKNSF